VHGTTTDSRSSKPDRGAVLPVHLVTPTKVLFRRSLCICHARPLLERSRAAPRSGSPRFGHMR